MFIFIKGEIDDQFKETQLRIFFIPQEPKVD